MFLIVISCVFRARFTFSLCLFSLFVAVWVFLFYLLFLCVTSLRGGRTSTAELPPCHLWWHILPPNLPNKMRMFRTMSLSYDPKKKHPSITQNRRMCVLCDRIMFYHVLHKLEFYHQPNSLL
jgi:hypothetical protein